MSTMVSTTSMTTEELLALPDDSVDRELIYGELRERPMTRRNRWHSKAESQIVQVLKNWLDRNPDCGLVVSGEAGFRLRRNPDSTVGIDVAYVSAEVASAHPDAIYFEGPPVLAVEILSPSDTQEQVDEKIRLYLETGVALVWIVHPRFKTITVYRQGEPPEMFSGSQEISAEPHLPGFRALMTQLF